MIAEIYSNLEYTYTYIDIFINIVFYSIRVTFIWTMNLCTFTYLQYVWKQHVWPGGRDSQTPKILDL